MPPRDWAPLPAAWAATAAEALGERLGREVVLTPGSLTCGTREELLAGGSACVISKLSAAGEPPTPLFFVTPRALAVAGAGADPAADDADEALPEEQIAAWSECAACLAGALSQLFSATGELPGVAHESSVELDPVPEEDVPPAGSYRRQTWSVVLAGEAAGELGLWLPEEAALAWFGAAVEGAAGAERRPLAVIHPDLEAREHAEALADALGRPVWSLDTAELGPHSFDELREAAAVIVAWDLGGVPGIDLLDDLRRDPRTAQLPVALAMAAPTRERVLAALRWGAVTVLGLPLEVEELSRRLELGAG